MSHCYTSKTEAEQDSMATGYGRWWLNILIPRSFPYNRGNLPSGMIICSAEDIGRYLIPHLNRGQYKDVTILSAENINLMQQPLSPSDGGNSYGIGWEIRPLEDGMLVPTHGGTNAHFQTFVLLIPEEKLGVAVIMNTNGMEVTGATNSIAYGVRDILNGQQPSTYETRNFMHIINLSAIGPAVLALLWIGWSMYRTFHRRKAGTPPPQGTIQIVWVIVLPLLLDIALIGYFVLLIPMLWNMPLKGIKFYGYPVYTLIISVSLLLILWGLARTLVNLTQGTKE
jgi:hypothetical protein